MSGQAPTATAVSDKTNVVSGDTATFTVTWNDPDNRTLTFQLPGTDGQGNVIPTTVTLTEHDTVTYPDQVASTEDPSVVAVKVSATGNQVVYRVQVP